MTFKKDERGAMSETKATRNATPEQLKLFGRVVEAIVNLPTKFHSAQSWIQILHQVHAVLDESSPTSASSSSLLRSMEILFRGINQFQSTSSNTEVANNKSSPFGNESLLRTTVQLGYALVQKLVRMDEQVDELNTNTTHAVLQPTALMIWISECCCHDECACV